MSEVNFDLLDSTVDDLQELEAFSPIPGGTHKCTIKWDTKDINGKPAVTLNFTVVETVEMASSSETPPEPGKSSDIAFILTKDDGEPNNVGQGQLRQVIEALHPTFGGDSIRETMENSEGAEVIATLKVRANKNDPDQKFNNLKSLYVE